MTRLFILGGVLALGGRRRTIRLRPIDVEQGDLSAGVSALRLVPSSRQARDVAARYEEARPWAKAIRDEVLNRRMPPWDAVKGFGQFRDDPSLSQVEMDMVVGWVEVGAPLGDPVPAYSSATCQRGGTRAAGREWVRRSTVLSAAMTLRGIRPLGGWK